MAWVYFNPNPDNKSVEDCTVRAICRVENMSWEDAYFSLCIMGAIVHDMPNANYVFHRLLAEWGYTYAPVENTCPHCYTVADFCADHSEGCFILGTGTHVIAVIDGNYFDATDSGSEIPLHCYHKEEGQLIDFHETE